jgi:UDP-N-acetylglucosamine 2-epimerase
VVVGSPAIDTLDAIEPMTDEQLTKHTGSTRVPDAVVLMHPAGRDPETEEAVTAAMLEALGDRVVVALHPNHDPGREGVLRALQAASEPTGKSTTPIKVVPHLVREHFVGLLKRVAQSRGVLIGNSSAGLIEAAALKIPVVSIGPRQAGRERPGHVVDAAHETVDAIGGALVRAKALDLTGLSHPYGDGRAGVRTADALASVDPHSQSLLRKRFVDATDGR